MDDQIIVGRDFGRSQSPKHLVHVCFSFCFSQLSVPELSMVWLSSQISPVSEIISHYFGDNLSHALLVIFQESACQIWGDNFRIN